MKHAKMLALVSGLSGIGLLTLGAIAYRRQAAGVSGLGLGRRGRHVRGRAAEAPVIGSYTSGGMTTTLREHPVMPIEMRVATIQDRIAKSLQDPKMREISLKATAHCPERDGRCEAEAVYNFVKANVRYTGDIAPVKWPDGNVEGVDLFQAARRTLEFGGGDCDDHNILVATMLAHNGITPRLRVVRTKAAKDWEHVFPGALLPKGTGDNFIALDTTLPGTHHFGREPSYHKFIDFDA